MFDKLAKAMFKVGLVHMCYFSTAYPIHTSLLLQTPYLNPYFLVAFNDSNTVQHVTHLSQNKTLSTDQETPFGEIICKKPGYSCKEISHGQTWRSLFPNKESRDIVQRLNRMNIRLKNGMTIAIPEDLERLTIFDIAPFPRYIQSEGEKMIYVDQSQLAWGAYDAEGELLWWGPISPGSNLCPNVLGGCLTPGGRFRIIRKQDVNCISTAFPRRANGIHGGAEMPYCMHFFRGYALHGSHELPGYPASHGCVRLFLEDAEWLNEEFIDIPGGGMPGTQVIISKSPTI